MASIFDAKQRPAFDPLIVHVASVGAIISYAERLPDWAEALLTRFSPGPLTIVLPKKPIIPDIVTSGLDTVAIRIPNHPLTLELLSMLPFPLAAPSANPFGYVSPTTAKHVADQLGGKIPYILDGGVCDVGLESTIVAEVASVPTILRVGGVAVEEIEAVIGRVGIRSHSSSDPIAPGMLESHYAPKRRVLHSLPETFDPKGGYIGFSESTPFVPQVQQVILSKSGNMREAARNLFSALRELDREGIETIYFDYVPDVGLGRAINDRLRRAAKSAHDL